MDRFFAIERNGRLSTTGYLINLLIAFSCIGTLVYPIFDAGGIVRIDCIFKSITGLPCPTCGYSTAIGCLLSGNIAHSFLHNPAWIFWLGLQVVLVFIGIKSLITGKQALISLKLIIGLAVILMLTWVAKFIIGPEFY
ncbi:DUF2752 domain-containing protein [Bacteroidota bacterium]